MNKKLLLTLSLSLLLSFSSCGVSSSNVSSSSSKEPISLVDEGSITKTINAKSFYNSNEEGSLNIYYFDNKDVPYVNLKEFYESSFIDSALDHKKIFSVENNIVTNLISNATMELDSVNDLLIFSDFDMFNNINGSTSLPDDIFTVSFYDQNLISIDQQNTSYTKGDDIVIDLKKYDSNIISYNNECYIPFSYLEAISISQNYYRYVFNGSDIYNVNLNLMINNNDTLNSYGKAYYSGAYNQNNQRTSDYASYFYHSFLFEMEYFNGKLPSLGITDLDAKLDELGLKEKLLSLNSSTADNALAKVINQIFNDGGHSCFNYRGNTVNYDSTINDRLFSDLKKYDTKYQTVLNTYTQLTYERGSLNQNLDISGSTAIIRFDDFNTTNEIIDLDHISSNSSTYGIIYNSFKEISLNPSINNVVFDLTCNLGGDSTGLAFAYSFISNDPIKVNIVNPVTNAHFTEAVKVDNDLDNDINDNDSYEGKYNFYVMTSNASFSSANMFALLAKDNSKAKIIGQKSSGGDCSIRSGISIDGTSFNMSSTLKYVFNDGTSADDGIELDYSLDSSYFYNSSKLDTYLSSIK